MSDMDEFPSLAAKFLIAMPGMQDPRFAHALVLMCEHTAGGAMGLIVNKPVPAFIKPLKPKLVVPRASVFAAPV